MIEYLERLAERVDPPIHKGIAAPSVGLAPGAEEPIVRSRAGDLGAANVVIAAARSVIHWLPVHVPCQG